MTNPFVPAEGGVRPHAKTTVDPAGSTVAVVTDAVVYVCPERDIECGDRAQNWCATCPKRARLAETDGSR